MTATRTRLLTAITATLLAAAGASLSSTAYAAPTSITADDDTTRPVNHVTRGKWVDGQVWEVPWDYPGSFLGGGSAGSPPATDPDVQYSWVDYSPGWANHKWSSGPDL
ncbi:hypothetical protein AB0D29_36730 [Streptomyces sp. NPDC048424]|uniref:hypothetical protein n=1 Tax=Streptomyces sp. NPDC048424 TaxID=3155265 RepID=UPI0034309E15